MIQVDITSQREPLHHKCGNRASFIETRGRSITHPKLLGAPSRTYHVECSVCGVCTQPSYQPHLVESLWRVGAHFHVDDLPGLRVKAEEALLRA